MAELCALHVFVTGGDAPHELAPHAATGHLGATLERADALGGYRIGRVYHQEPDLLASKPASPFDHPLGTTLRCFILTASCLLPGLYSLSFC